MSVAEATARYGLRTGTDQEAYKQLIAELSEDRWAQLTEKWMKKVREGGADLPEEPKEEELGVVGIKAARRTAKCIGGWERSAGGMGRRRRRTDVGKRGGYSAKDGERHDRGG